MNFQPSNTPTGPLYHVNTILKIGDFVNCKNAFFVLITLKKKIHQKLKTQYLKHFLSTIIMSKLWYKYYLTVTVIICLIIFNI